MFFSTSLTLSTHICLGLSMDLLPVSLVPGTIHFETILCNCITFSCTDRRLSIFLISLFLHLPIPVFILSIWVILVLFFASCSILTLSLSVAPRYFNNYSKLPSNFLFQGYGTNRFFSNCYYLAAFFIYLISSSTTRIFFIVLNIVFIAAATPLKLKFRKNII